MQRKLNILLSASVPTEERTNEYRKIENAQIQIEEAVIGLARNIFQANGRLVFGGHPSISPLVAMIATEYELDKESENIHRNERQSKQVIIYQSRAFEEVLPDETSTLFNLGYAQIVWTQAVDGEKCDLEIRDQPQCPQSLRLMRENMIGQDLDAMVCMGGMEGVEDEFSMFVKNHPKKPVYLLKSTGGAANNIAENPPENTNIIVADRDYSSRKPDEKPSPEREPFEIIPYTFITAGIVQDLQESQNY